jgi:peptidoglycan/LPS O-acetylase OafA/YrhL
VGISLRQNASRAARIGAIDSLRCFAMTAVVLQHCSLLPFGWTGVWLFFVISGYVVTLTVIDRPDAPSRGGLAGFFRRRTLRIVPIYYAYAGLGLAVVLATGSAVDPLAAASLLGFFNNAAMALGRGELSGWPVGHLWTISSEMQFYLLYGVALFTLPRRAVVGLLFAAILLAPAARFAGSSALGSLGWGDEARAYAIYVGPMLHADAFAAGALLAFAGRLGVLDRTARPLAVAGAVALGAYAAIYVGINYAVVGARGLDAVRNVVSGVLVGQHREVFLYSALNVASAGVVALAATKDRWLFWLLSWRPLRRIGEISYGAYVYHALAIVAAVQLLSPVLDTASAERPMAVRAAVFALAYALTLAAAEASYRWFERRIIRVGKPRQAVRAGPGPVGPRITAAE